jgi:hypothetical protein
MYHICKPVLSVVLYGCQTGLVCTSKEEPEVQVLEKFRKIVGPWNDEVIGKILHKKKFYGLYGSSNILRVVKSRNL